MPPSIRVPGRSLAPAILLASALLLPGAAAAQEPPPTPAEPTPTTTAPPATQPTSAPATAPAAEPTPPPAVAAPGTPAESQPPKAREETFLPRLDIFFPEGDLDLRVNRLLRKVFFEGQVKYNFINGNIAAFLRYRYYGYQRTTQFTVFDTIEFQDVQDFSSDFDRVRGSLLLMQWPHSYHQRTFGLVELDRISSNKEGVIEVLRLGRTNTFVRFGYQLGTPEDSRSNAIVGETRARTERLFTAFREIGPGGAGFTGAVTYGFGLGVGDFDYVKLEAETLKRLDVTAHSFLIARLHAGTFLYKGLREGSGLPAEHDRFDLYMIPRGEFFRLDGRESLKGVTEKLRGTEELHTTVEYFIPWFLNANHKFLRLDWQNWYWILYAGAGTVGFERSTYTDLGSYVPDAGLGFESSFKLRKYRFFLSGIVAQALKGNGGVEARISVKSYH
jgi:hypothetical protein